MISYKQNRNFKNLLIKIINLHRINKMFLIKHFQNLKIYHLLQKIKFKKILKNIKKLK